MAGQVGAVVALDPRDGAVRVLLSQPAFDPDLFAGHLEPARWHELTSDPLEAAAQPRPSGALPARLDDQAAVRGRGPAGRRTDAVRHASTAPAA